MRAEAEQGPDFACIGRLWLSEVTLAKECPRQSRRTPLPPCLVLSRMLLHPKARGGLETEKSPVLAVQPLPRGRFQAWGI